MTDQTNKHEAAELGLGVPSARNAEPSPGNAGPSPGNAEPQLGALKLLGWHSRGYLPHLDAVGVVQSITFRLADSLPRAKLEQLRQTVQTLPASLRDATLRRAIDRWLHAGAGCCALRHPELAALMQETLFKFDGKRYLLLAWCVMPNHVHALIQPNASLAKIVQSWKSYTGRWALARNAELGLGVPGDALWMRDYWDRYIRDQPQMDAVTEYIHQNPVAAGLCRTPQQWPWSSASRAFPKLPS